MQWQNHEVVPVVPGTLLRMLPERQGKDVFPKRTTFLGKDIPFEDHPIFEVESYVFDRDGGHVTFHRGGEGTFVVFGGGRIERVKFPYPHPMFEVVGETEAVRIRAEWAAFDFIKRTTHPLGRWLRWLDRLPWRTARLAQA